MKNLMIIGLIFINSALPHSAQAGEAEACIKRTIKNYRPVVDRPQRSDKFKHCALSCVLSLECGPTQAWAVGVFKEIVDVFGPGEADLKDLKADRMGIQQVKRGYAHNRHDCESACIRIYPDPPAGI